MRFMVGSGTHPLPEALYFHIASDAAIAAVTASDEFRRAELVATSLVFTALAAEAFINQQYHRLGLKDPRQLSLKNKWLGLAQSIPGALTQLSNSAEFAVLCELIKLRNGRLVHFTPKHETRIEGRVYSDPPLHSLLCDVPRAAKYVDALHQCIETLHADTKGRTELPMFLKGVRYIAHVQSSVTVATENRGRVSS